MGCDMSFMKKAALQSVGKRDGGAAGGEKYEKRILNNCAHGRAQYREYQLQKVLTDVLGRGRTGDQALEALF